MRFGIRIIFSFLFDIYVLWLRVFPKYTRNDCHTFIVGRNIGDVEPGLLMDDELEIWKYMIKTKAKLYLFYQSIDSEILMKFLKLKIQPIYSSRDEIREFFINKDGDIMEFKVDSSIEITETTLIRNLELRSCENIVYELKVQNYNGVSVPMIKYRDEVLIVSFMREKYNMYYVTDYYKEKIQSLIHLANNFKSFDLKILIIMDLSKQIQRERYEEQKMYTLLSQNKENTKVHLYKDDNDSDILMHFLKLKVQVLESTRDELGAFIINKNWNVMEFKVNSSIKEIKEMLKKMEHVIKEKHNVNTDLTL